VSDRDTRELLDRWLVATPVNVFVHGRVWTLATSVFVERDPSRCCSTPS